MKRAVRRAVRVGEGVLCIQVAVVVQTVGGKALRGLRSVVRESPTTKGTPIFMLLVMTQLPAAEVLAVPTASSRVLTSTRPSIGTAARVSRPQIELSC